MDVLVPFDVRDPKSRLDSVLDADERAAFARATCRDVLDALAAAGFEPTVLATAAVDWPPSVVVDDRPLTTAVNAALTERGPPLAVVMADLPLATPAALSRLTKPDADVVLAPGLGGGTNALVVRTADFAVDFHDASIRDHRAAARSAGASVASVDSFRLACDVDEPADLAEVLLHADGRAADWLADAGFELSVTAGRATVTRAPETG